MKDITLYIEGLTKPEPIDNYEVIDIIELEDVPDGSCSNIMAKFVLDYVINRQESISQILKKVAYNGTITIYGHDLISISINIVKGELNADQIQDKLYNNKTSVVSLVNIVDTLQQNEQYVITKQQLCDGLYVVQAKRVSKHDQNNM